MIDRRTVLVGMAALSLAPHRASASEPVAYAGACRERDGRFAVLLLAEHGGILRRIAVPARAHDITRHGASGRAVAFARRPGQFAIAFEINRPTPPVLFAPPDGRNFFGHGVFSRDGRLLYATENDFTAARGCLGIYDVAAGYRRIGEFPSHGVGPHEVILSGGCLVVANGGIDTHPDSGRDAIDPLTMQPSLVFLDATSGDLLAKHTLPDTLQPLSIRHLAADAAGRVWFGGQWEGPADTTPELLGHATPDTPLRLITPQLPLGARLAGYIGSVAADEAGETIAATAPRGGMVVRIRAADGAVLSSNAIADAGGIAGHGRGFAVSTGAGRMYALDEQGASGLSETLPAMDNHLECILG